MCGICGFTWEDKALVQKMMDAITHRGPDDSGSFCFRDISLGHRRLSIIDLSSKGHQPMSNEDGSVWIVFNGEIYNHLQLRKDLESKGHRFMSGTDTEAILHGYEEYGTRVLERLNGFFGFAIYDTVTKSLFLARDRLGIKPVYYAQTEKGEIVFASEIKSLLALGMAREVDLAALHDYLSFRCVTVSQTMFRGIKRLPPGHYLLKNKDGINIRRYWDITLSSTHDFHEEHYYAQELHDRLSESVRKRLMSDVPIGAYLSGGIDSASVVGLMNKMMDQPVKTFTVGFGIEGQEDELRAARVTAEHFGTDHQEVMVDPDTAKILPQVVWHLDEPMSDPTCIPTYLLSKEAKKKCTVILTGEGADEQLAGYSQYKMMLLHERFRMIPSFMRKAGAKTSRIVPAQILNTMFKYAGALGERGKERFAEFAGSDEKSRMYLQLVSIYNEEEKQELLTPQVRRRTQTIDLPGRLDEYFRKKAQPLDQLLYLESKTLLPENLLMKVDKNTMAFGIEARVPFLDHTLVDFNFTVPPRFKLSGQTEKYILRKAMKDLLPKSTLERKKEHFFVPIDSWFSGELKEVGKQVLSEERMKRLGYFEPKAIEQAFRGLSSSRLFYSRQLWSLLSFSLWHAIYIEGDAKKPPKGIGGMI